MKRVLMYGSAVFPECVEAKARLDALEGFKYAFLDVTASMGALQRFLRQRDESPEFAEIRANDEVGLPCFIVNKTEILFSLPEDLSVWTED